MAHLLTGDDKFRGLIYDGEDRPDPVPSSDYRFACAHGGVRVRIALRRAGFQLKKIIEAIVDVKLRRMERELEILGYDRRSDRRVAGNPGRTRLGED